MKFHFLFTIITLTGLSVANPAQKAEVELQTCLALAEYTIDPFRTCIWPLILEDVDVFIQKGARVDVPRLEECSLECSKTAPPDGAPDRITTLRLCITDCFHRVVTREIIVAPEIPPGEIPIQ